MKSRLTGFSLLVLLLTLAAVPAKAADIQLLYSNGPVDGYTDAWTINFGYEVSNSFAVGSSATVTSFSFSNWVYPGDIPLTVDWSITSNEFGGTTYGSGTSPLINAFQFNNGFPNGGYDIYISTVTNISVPLAAGSYWLNLQNAVTAQGNPMFWDENSGVGCTGTGGGANCPALASESAVGTIPSEDPDFFGYTSGGGGQTPEPGSILLFGSGMVALAGVLRRRLC